MTEICDRDRSRDSEETPEAVAGGQGQEGRDMTLSSGSRPPPKYRHSLRAVGGPPAAWLKKNVGSKAGSPLEGQACAP